MRLFGGERSTGASSAAALLLLTAVLGVLFAHVRIRGPLMDDASITFRYAANLASGLGPVYNPGEAVLGTTTPLWALILSGLALLVGPEALPAAARILAGVLLAAAAGVAWRLVEILTGRRTAGVVAGLVVLLGPHAILSSLGGMEAPLTTLLVLGAVLALTTERWTAAGIAAGLAPLARPEGALAAVAVLGAWAVARRGEGRRGPPTAGDAARRPGGTLPLLVVVPGLVFAVAATLYYGSPVPQSIQAKLVGIYPVGLAGSARHLSHGVANSLTGGGLLESALPGLWVVPLLVATVLALRWNRRSWPLVLLLWGYVVFFATSGTMIFPWYVALVEPLALGGWAVALYAAGRGLLRLLSFLPPGPPSGTGAAERAGPRWLLPVVGAVVLLHPLTMVPWHSIRAGEPAPEDVVISPPMMRLAFYRAAAEVLGPAIPAGATVLMPEIGVLGFTMSHVRVLDPAGLVSPSAVPFLPIPADERVSLEVGAIPTGLVRSEEPDLVVTLEIFARESIYRDPWFQERYATVWRWQDPRLVWGGLRVHAREGYAPGQALRSLPGGVVPPGDPETAGGPQGPR